MQNNCFQIIKLLIFIVNSCKWPIFLIKLIPNIDMTALNLLIFQQIAFFSRLKLFYKVLLATLNDMFDICHIFPTNFSSSKAFSLHNTNWLLFYRNFFPKILLHSILNYLLHQSCQKLFLIRHAMLIRSKKVICWEKKKQNQSTIQWFHDLRQIFKVLMRNLRNYFSRTYNSLEEMCVKEPYHNFFLNIITFQIRLACQN